MCHQAGDGCSYQSPVALLARVTANGTSLPSRCSWRTCSTRTPSSTSQPSKVSSACWDECQHFVREGFVLRGLWEVGVTSSRAMARLRARHLLPSQIVALCYSIQPGATCGLHAKFLKLETSSPSYSYSLELVAIPVRGLCHQLGLQFWPGTH